MNEKLNQIRHKIIILSGKGGVGKSTIASNLALAFQKLGLKIGLLDIDLCGPSIPKIIGLQEKEVKKCSEGWIPIYKDNNSSLAVMSIGFLLPNNDSAVIWRGPKKTVMIRQFLEDVYWGELDCLIIDTPPGTSDEHIAIVENLKEYNPDGAIIVTTPQNVSISDVRKEITFCKKINLPILGIIENMSGFICPHCSECTNIFSSEGGFLLSKELNIPFIGKIPIDPQLTICEENGQNFFETFPNSTSLQPLIHFVQSFQNKYFLDKNLST